MRATERFEEAEDDSPLEFKLTLIINFNHKLKLTSSGNFAQTFKHCYAITVLITSIFCVL